MSARREFDAVVIGSGMGGLGSYSQTGVEEVGRISNGNTLGVRFHQDKIYLVGTPGVRIWGCS